MSFARAREVADAVMMEGYTLYPYRPSAPKNRYRWTFGVLAPEAWSEAGGCESSWIETQLLVAGQPMRITGQLRFFEIERSNGWDEGIAREIEFDGSQLFAVGQLRGRISVRRDQVASGLWRVTVRVDNLTPWTDLGASREQALAAAFAGTHLLLATDGGEWLSAIDPPVAMRAAAATCRSTRTYPVLVDDLVLCAPFILYDHPTIAPESAGDMCDACEIDELLLLRARTLTDAEKREVIAIGGRSAEILARAEAMTEQQLARLHGAERDLRDSGEMIPKRLTVGSKVMLKTPNRHTDAQDLLFAGHRATIAEIKEDVDGTIFYAVTVDDDPATELHDWYGRYRYYRGDEVEPL
jgi:hypothetical protein